MSERQFNFDFLNLKKNVSALNLRQHIHYSVDDIFNSLVNLSTNEYDSIFEEQHFSFLKDLHEKYGLKISCYVFYENEQWNLTELTDDYIKEFKDNSDWLSFGFHSLNTKTNYKNATSLQAESDYNKVIEELTRIVGEISIDRTVRLHNYAASKEAVEGFKNAHLGIEALLCPENKRLTYDLNKEQTNYLNLYNHYQKKDIEYIKTDIRMENLDDIQEFYKQFIFDKDQNDRLVIFTHEKYLIDKEIQNKTYQILNLYANAFSK